MSVQSKNPPKFSSSKDYQTYKREVDTWTKVTKEEKKNWGNIIALSLPEDDPSDIRRKVFAGVAFDGEAGFKTLMDFLDEEFSKDEVLDACEKIRALVTHKKDPSATMKQYISGFDAKYVLAQKAGLNAMPQEYLMFHLMENCNLHESEYRLVMSAIDMSKKDELYKQAKSALIKFFASMRPDSYKNEGDVSTLPNMKIEEEDTLYAGGQNYGRGNFRGRGGFRPRGNFNQGTWRNSNPQNFQDRNFSKPINNVGKDGKPQLCHSCGSYRHLQASCPDRFEAYVEGEDQDQTSHEEVNDEEQFVAMNTFEIFDAQIGIIKPHEVFASVVLDTGCIKSVCGKGWFNDFVSTLSPKTKQQIKVLPSDKIFKFGGNLRKKSLGYYQIPCSLANKNILLGIDVVDTQIPCLISKEAMKRGKTKINVEEDKIEIFGKMLDLKTTQSGHYILPLNDVMENVADVELQVFIADENFQDEKYQEKELERIHRALGLLNLNYIALPSFITYTIHGRVF